MIAFARWIEGLLQRLYPHSFVADAVDSQAVKVDGSEIVEARWVEPAQALNDGSLVASPTVMQLERPAAFTDKDALLAACRGLTITRSCPGWSTTTGRR